MMMNRIEHLAGVKFAAAKNKAGLGAIPSQALLALRYHLLNRSDGVQSLSLP